jgi:hypothetical protein
LDEWIDPVPVNKIIGFGRDFGVPGLECICGHLMMAKENIACVLAGRIDDDLTGIGEAIAVAQGRLYDVSQEAYRL